MQQQQQWSSADVPTSADAPTADAPTADVSTGDVSTGDVNAGDVNAGGVGTLSHTSNHARELGLDTSTKMAQDAPRKMEPPNERSG